MARVRDDFWMRGKTTPGGTEVRVEATKYRTDHWGVRVIEGRETELWGKAYKDEDLPDAVDGDAVIEHAWEACCKELDLE